MSNIFQLYARKNNGSVPLSVGTGLLIDPIKSQGLNLSEDGGIYAAQAVAINHYNQGLPFDEFGRLVVDVAPIDYVSMGMPFTASGTLAVGSGDIERYDQGVGFTADGALAATLQSAVNLYINPEMDGGSDIVDGVGDIPDNHTTANNTDNISATFTQDGNPAYDYNAANVLGRYVLRQTRGTTGDLDVGTRYRFQAEMFIDNYDGSNVQMLRGTNVNNNDSLIINRDNTDHSGTNGAWNLVYVDFDIFAATDVIFLQHGQGTITDSDLNTRYRNIGLYSLGVAPATCTSQPLSDETVTEGSEKSIPSEWVLAVRYQWFFDDDTGNFRAINDGQTYQGTTTDTLVIQSMSEANEGRYICVGFNVDDVRTDSDVAIIRTPADFNQNDFKDGDFVA